MNSELLGAAQAYHEQGISVIPVKSKQPLIEWRKYQTNPQSQKELEEIPWEKADGFAIVCGTPLTVNDETVYSSGVDRDIKDPKIPEEIKQKTLQATNQMRVTHREKTKSGGNHLLYFSRKPVKGKKLNNIGIELLGAGNLMIMAPSEGYTLENDNPVTIVDDVEKMFFEVLENIGLYTAFTKPNILSPLPEIKQNTLRPCFEKLLRKSHLEHDEKVALIYELVHTGKTDDEIKQLFLTNKAWEPSPEHNFNIPETIQQLEYTLKKARTGNYRWKRDTLWNKGICYKDCPLWALRDCRKPHQEAQEKETENQADRAVKLCLSREIELFHDQHNAPYARVTVTDAIDAIDAFPESYREPQNSHKEIIRLRDTAFKTHIAYLMYEAEGKVIGQEAINNALLILQQKALMGKQYTLYNRVAPDPSGDGSIWLYMADNARRAYHITKDGWTIENDTPILFRHYGHMQALPEATKGGDPWKLLNYINVGKASLKVSEIPQVPSIASKYEQKRLLLMVHCASYLIPDIPHPILANYGCKGTWKSSSQKFVRGIFDPSSVPLLRFPRDEDALIQQLEHHWIPIYDNLSTIPRWFSDSICSAVTGAGQETRALYTDDDVVIRQFKRCIMLNGINLPAQQGDLLDRAILHETIPDPEARRTEEELNLAYRRDCPGILGGFLDLTVKALQLKDEVAPSKLFRLADFTRWGCAFAQALGRKEEEFIAAFETNVQSQNEETAHASPVASAFISYCEKLNSEPTDSNPFISTPEAVFLDVEKQAQQMNINTKQKMWPKAPQAFTRRLNEAKDAIVALGWNYEVIPNGAKRELHIWATSKAKTEPVFVESIPYGSQPHARCPGCNRAAVLEKSVRYSNGSTICMCIVCGGEIEDKLRKKDPSLIQVTN